MNIHADKNSANKSRAVANRFQQQQSSGESTLLLGDNQPVAIAQRKRQKPADNSTRVSPLSNFQGLANNNPQAQQAARWQSTTNNRSAQPIQKQGLEEEELLQGKFEPIQKKENKTGLPDNLKSGVENLSGMSLDHVKVHYNSDKPAQLQAHAYAQGTDIHIASGQEKHLPHEAWHVVQQAQGRVEPTMQMKGGVPVNDDAGLEREADVMGAKAATVVNMSDPLGIFQRRAESAEVHPQREPAGGQGEKGTLSFLSSPSKISSLYSTRKTGNSFENKENAMGFAVVQRIQIGGKEVTSSQIEEEEEFDDFLKELDIQGVNLRFFFVAIDAKKIVNLDGKSPKEWAESAKEQMKGREKEFEALLNKDLDSRKEEMAKWRKEKAAPEGDPVPLKKEDPVLTALKTAMGSEDSTLLTSEFGKIRSINSRTHKHIVFCEKGVAAIAKQGSEDKLTIEKNALQTMSDEGCSAVKILRPIEILNIGELQCHAYLMEDASGLHSKENNKTFQRRLYDMDNTCKDTSRECLTKILEFCQKFSINDIQLMLMANGSIKVLDPVGLKEGKSESNIKFIEDLIERLDNSKLRPGDSEPDKGDKAV